MPHSSPGRLVQQGRFRHLNRSLFGARILLHQHALILKGWSWRGAYKRTFPLETIADIEWWEGKNDCNFALKFNDGESMGLWVKGAGLWKYEIEEQQRKALRD